MAQFYRKRPDPPPSPVEAIQWMEDNREEAKAFLGDAFLCTYLKDGALAFATREGTRVAQPGYWIVKRPDGAFQCYRKDIFYAMYESTDP